MAYMLYTLWSNSSAAGGTCTHTYSPSNLPSQDDRGIMMGYPTKKSRDVKIMQRGNISKVLKIFEFGIQAWPVLLFFSCFLSLLLVTIIGLALVVYFFPFEVDLIKTHWNGRVGQDALVVLERKAFDGQRI
uniref:Uncharacterized protein n=1 Tax=Photinus pyralis TaxID=7054 RepID=A0A1Y1NA05_PHOPY